MTDIVDCLKGVPNDTAKEAMEEILMLRRKVSQRGARMQLMAQYLKNCFVYLPSNFEKRFDKDGVPL